MLTSPASTATNYGLGKHFLLLSEGTYRMYFIVSRLWRQLGARCSCFCLFLIVFLCRQYVLHHVVDLHQTFAAVSVPQNLRERLYFPEVHRRPYLDLCNVGFHIL